MPTSERFQATFERLKQILEPYEPALVVRTDGPGAYELYTPFVQKYNRDIFFGSAKIQKRYVSYYLMPVYVFPDLLDGLSPDLKRRMQGKSCFNLTAPDETLLAGLTDLTRRGFERFRHEGIL